MLLRVSEVVMYVHAACPRTFVLVAAVDVVAFMLFVLVLFVAVMVRWSKTPVAVDRENVASI